MQNKFFKHEIPQIKTAWQLFVQIISSGINTYLNQNVKRNKETSA